MSKPSPIWRSRDPLTLLEAAALLANVDPASVEFDYTASKPKHADGGVLAAYAILEEAVMTGELAAEAGHELLYAAVSRDGEERKAYRSSPSPRYTKIKQQDLTDWAKNRGVPLGFFAGSGKEMSALGARTETTYLNIIGGLLELMLGKTPAGKPQSVFDSQAAIIAAMLAHFEGKPGISERTLEDKFAAARRSLSET